jgi:sugar transferase (PEP-CTERM/EpsH1 system associated)
MRELLFLAHRIPYPPNKGDKIRAWHFLQHLARTYRVHLGCFVDDEHDWAHVPVLKELAGETCFVPLHRRRALARSLSALLSDRPLTLPYYHDARLAAWVTRLRRNRPMLAFVYSSSMAQYVMEDVGSPRIIDFVDVDSQKWVEYSARRQWPMAEIYRREGRALLKVERAIARQFDASLFVSEAEASLFRRLAPEASDQISAVSIGVDVERFSPDIAHPDPYAGAGRTALCFTGMMDYWPNVDAVGWFAQSVFPRIQAVHPSATFWIVGANPVRSVRKLASLPGVIVTGRVADTRPFLAHASAVVAPLRVARGIQSKVLEAMALGRPVVASYHAFEGLRVQRDVDLIVARSAEDFIGAIERIWDPRFGAALGARARQAVCEQYYWPQQLTALDDVVARLDTRPATSGLPSDADTAPAVNA